MKVYISADLEGISGMVSWDQMKEGTPEYEKAVDLMLKEVNAAVVGALKGGASEVIVNDSHGYMRNLPIEGLHRQARLISGFIKPLSMVEGVEEADLAFFIGYHAGVGTKASICDHSYSSSSVFRLRINGVDYSETAINAAVCGYFRVPVGLVTGDRETVKQAKAFLAGVLTVETKIGISRFAAACRHPLEVRQEIEEKAQAALSKFKEGGFQALCVEAPVDLEVTFTQTGKADVAELLPGTERLDGRTVHYRGKDILEAFRVLQALLLLARSVS